MRVNNISIKLNRYLNTEKHAPFRNIKNIEFRNDFAKIIPCDGVVVFLTKTEKFLYSFILVFKRREVEGYKHRRIDDFHRNAFDFVIGEDENILCD